MQLKRLIDEGESIEKESYGGDIFKEKSNSWMGDSIKYLRDNYPQSILTNDFISESEKADKNFHNMVAILKGLKDVEAELGLLDEK
ncbi:hypothetical protein [Wukongibacter sp. M2B1]|uniref:hypothetical protein n=1 Tax=Wukongibacter sp. M2B1 TaxID=3088895 RepID=UPI003D7B05D1